MQNIVEFLNEVTGLGCLYERGRRLDQRPAHREPDLAVRPQAEVIEPGNVIKGVVATTMRIARSAGQFPEFSESGSSGTSAQSRHQLRQGSDSLFADEFGGGIGGVGSWSHYGPFAPLLA